ncbi:NUDIX hydrolase [Roseococcus sp.]|uniref:NUDIX hydrolase n=1 Tax=Roseococcus sp. TaxID=2109646 RepID=UPI003BA8ED06
MNTSTTIPVTPRPAAAILLLRDAAAGLEVLMICRAKAMSFAGGAMAFPGGRIDDADALLAPQGDPLGAFRIGAIREAWEETGMLLARPTAVATDSGTEFHAHLREQGLTPDHAALTPFAHWITPEQSPKRFDTHFFLAEAPEGQEAQHDGSETEEAIWLRPDQVIKEAEAGLRTLVFPTRLNLLRLSRHATAAEAIAAARATPVVTVMPRPEPDGQGGTNLRIPEAAGYGAALWPAKDRPSFGGSWPGQTPR